ncbi:GSCFA family protein [Tenacibaculum skagerrakense]|uniref:GSCFA family protein n=1 Tax=Tenacibaculum skagerrakense TaxID=186571 RepID=A0A4R2NUA1_9FLAO|nr:GSCFA domain-containing protein [Tenacibaculum skagerrakense]TCP25084.1 GSCFA family protein [Tenacibaculum skagerrakense]
MNLQTQIPLQKQAYHQIDYNSKLFLLGSCFSENIGNKLSYYKFQSVQNPLGILFHPKAIEQLILNAINSKEYSEEDIFELNERWHCFEAHSDLSASSGEELIENLTNAIKITQSQITNATHIIITLGTAWVYRYISSDSIVANCHKVPQKQFLKELLSIDEITESLDSICELIKSVNPKASILFTVSPIRHIKDGFIENQQSKSHLIAGIHNLVEPRKNIHYFPSYELMMDELRDYRFYREDMIHPNQTAINYIWEKFVYTWFSESSLATMKRVEEIQKGLTHKPFNPNSEAHQKFLEKLTLKQEQLTQEFSFIKF